MLKLNLEEVFVTEGVPAFTFVKPQNYNRILLDVRSQGKPVIVEGQCGTGKTTCIRQILNDLADEFFAQQILRPDFVMVRWLGKDGDI